MKLNEEINLKTKSVLNRSKPKPPNHHKPSPSLSKDIKPQQITKPTVEQNNPSKSSSNTQEKEPVRDSPSSETDDLQPKCKSSSQKPAAIPKSLERRNLSSEGLVKFLKSKVTILQEEIDIHQKENLKKSEELQSLQQKTGKLQQHRDQLNVKNNSLQADLKRAEDRIIELELKVKERDNDSVGLKKEGDCSRRDLKKLEATNGALEKRLVHLQNEVEALRVSLASAYDRERETRDGARLEKDRAERQVKHLRKQRVSLIAAYKHQLLLLDNIQRQNVCLEEAKMLEFSEKEFTKILNWEKS